MNNFLKSLKGLTVSEATHKIKEQGMDVCIIPEGIIPADELDLTTFARPNTVVLLSITHQNLGLHHVDNRVKLAISRNE